MARQRPGSVTAAAVMCIIYGSLFTLCGSCSLLSLALQSAGKNLFGGGNPQLEQAQKQLQDALEDDMPAHPAVEVSGTVLELVEALALLVAGIGLISIQRWARTLVFVTAIITILSTLFHAVYVAGFVIPSINRAPAAQANDEVRFMRMALVATYTAAAVVDVLAVVYLLIVVLLLRRRQVRAAFAAGGLDGEAEEQHEPMQEDEGWGRSGDQPGPEEDWRFR
jgi:hypothetical protein